MKRLLVPILFAAAVVAASADEPSPLAGYHLKNKSVATVEPGRPPFWPIGYTHHDKGKFAEVKEEVTLDPKMFSVTSILAGHPSLAVINGRAYGEGDFLKVGKKLGVTAKILVQKIEDGRVMLLCEKQSVSISLKRPEFGEHKGQKTLDDDDN